MSWSRWIGFIASRRAAPAKLTVFLLLASAVAAFADPLDRPFHNWQAQKFRGIQRQRTDFTCGAASLAILSQYWDKPIIEGSFTDAIRKSHSKQEWEDIEKNGLSMLDLKRAVQKFGFAAEGLKLTLDQLRQVKGPVMIHLDKGYLQHFSVFKGFQGDRAYLADPINGNSRVPLYRFANEWTGYVLAIWIEGKNLPAINKLAPDPNDVPVEQTAIRGALYHAPDRTIYPFNY
jgi:predicted double-glycine peptidase